MLLQEMLHAALEQLLLLQGSCRFMLPAQILDLSQLMPDLILDAVVLLPCPFKGLQDNCVIKASR